MNRRRSRLVALSLALTAAVLVFLVASEVFPYHSTNHDEGVYLQQAAMLLEGQLFLRPPVETSFHPWFFVDAESPNGPAVPVPDTSGDVLYPKYAPLPAAVFSLGLSVGVPRLSLALVGGAIVALTYALTSEVFDRRHGLLAAGLMLGSPLFLIDTSVFLPYAPTTMLNLLFGWAYLRADRLATGDAPARRVYLLAAVAGLAVGAAFFARPYTAVLFAAPFVVHALWRLRGAVEGLAEDAAALDRDSLVRLGLVAAGGLLGVAATLGYNLVVTGKPFVFPYAAFAPHDGLGFGHREILGYDRQYTPALALRANAEVLWVLFTRWVVAGPVGTLVAALGLAAALRPVRTVDPRRLVLAGVAVSVALGNVYFWGNLNILGGLADPGDGLVVFLGPYYHFDVLLPVAAFGAHGLLVTVERWRALVTDHVAADRAGRVALTGLLFGSAVFAGASASVIAGPVRENAAVGEQLEAAYQPVVEREFDDALVFLPTPYGPWLNHPFQYLLNDPGYDADAVYALRENQFAVVDAFPNRTLYRYTYRGQWAPFLGPPVEPRLQPVRHVSGDAATMRARLGVPASVQSISLRLSAEGDEAYYVANGTPDTLPLRIVVANGSARLAGDLREIGAGDGSVPVDDRTDVELVVHLDTGGLGGFDYRVALPVATDDGTVRLLTPYVEVCTRPRLCGGEQAYVPGTHRDGVTVSVRVTASE